MDVNGCKCLKFDLHVIHGFNLSKKYIMVTRFNDLICWQKALALAQIVYASTENLKDFGLKDQLRRAAVSAMNNIAEGFGKINKTDAMRYFGYSTASCMEVESMTFLMERIKITDE